MKSLLIFFFIITSCLSSYSQVRGGIKGGANFLYSNWEIPGLARSYSGVSYHVGIYANIELKQRIVLQSEIQFNSFQIDYSGETYTANYLSIPIICSYSLLNNLLNIHAGPQASFLISAKPNTLETAIGNNELSVVIGSGITLKKFNITVRYGIGITNLASDEVKELFPDARIKNSNLQLSFGYQFFGSSR